LKRRGGFGFIPRRLSNEEAFLGSLDFRGKTVFDVGAYQGIYTMFFARAVGPRGRVVAFEPNPVNYEAITDNIELNGFTAVTVKAMALSDRTGTADLLFPIREPARGSLRADYQSSLAGRFESRKVKVLLDTLDNQLAELPAPDFVKIDVEGAELEVLDGMPTLLEEHHPSLFIEVHSGVDVRRLVRLLADSGYDMRDVDREITITPDNAVAFENGHLYCSACAEVLAPDQLEVVLAAA
jgi:FkbM family methyltransferase